MDEAAKQALAEKRREILKKARAAKGASKAAKPIDADGGFKDVPAGVAPLKFIENEQDKAKGKLPGIWEVRRIGTYGFVFASFTSGGQFWVEFSKNTDRKALIDLFDTHFEQYPWKLGSMDENRRIPVWVYEPKDENGKEKALQYYHFKSGLIHDVLDLERVLDEKVSKEQGRPHYHWFILDGEGAKVEVRIGEGSFGQLKEDCVVGNVQDVKADAVRALWPNRTMRMSFEGNVFDRMTMKPVQAVETVRDRNQGLQAPEGTKIAGVESGKLDRPIKGVFNPAGV